MLVELQHDGRMTNLELADRVGLAPTSTSDRLRRLRQNGFITGFRAMVDPGMVGLDLLVLIEVCLDKTTPDVFDKFSSAVRLQPEIIECHMVAGGFDYLIKARLPNMTRYRTFLGEILLSLPGVRETHTYPVIEEVKSDGILPL